MSLVPVTITINGTPTTAQVEPRMLLVQFLRDELELTGTHVGCDTSQCGACTVSLNGEAVKSCTLFAVQADGMQVQTIEGIGSVDDLHPIQAAFWEQHGLQCGFCTPGMIMAAAEIIRRNPTPAKRRSASNSTETFAAAPATTTSSRRSVRRRR